MNKKIFSIMFAACFLILTNALAITYEFDEPWTGSSGVYTTHGIFSDVTSWWYLKDHSGFDSGGYNDDFVYTFSESSTTQYCAWLQSISGTKQFEVFVWIPDPDAFDPTPNTSYKNYYDPTSYAKYRIYTSDRGKIEVVISQNVSYSKWVSLGKHNFNGEIKITLGDDTSEGSSGRKTIAFDAVKFVEVIEKPDTPSLSSPSSGSTNVSRTVKLDWSYVSEATYRVQLSRYSTFSSNIINQTTSNSYYNIPSGTLSYDTKYYWRVRSEKDGQSSDYSSYRYFTTEKQKLPPTASISSISPNPAEENQSVYFSGSGNDPDGGSISSYEWRSSIDGFLSSQNSFSSSNLSVGTHTISFKVKDDEGVWSSEITENLIVKRKTSDPTASIDNISPNPAEENESISFSGTGNDPDGGSISSYEWRSSRDGVLSSQRTFSKSLSVGTHTISFKVKDDEGVWSKDVTSTLTVNKKSEKPTASITSISPNPAQKNESINFSGSGSDPDGGSIVAYEWYSDLDGTLSTLASFKSSLLRVGTHNICFRVKDDEQDWSDDKCISLVVKEAVSDPVALLNNVPVSNISINALEGHLYYIDVPEKATFCVINTENVTGDPVDLYVKKDSIPTVSDYSARSYSGKGDEKIRIDASGTDGLDGQDGNIKKAFSLTLSAGKYYILVYSEKTSGTYSLRAKFVEFAFPFSGSNWQITRAYNIATHTSTQQKYSLDFAQSGCESYGKPVLAVEEGIISVNSFSTQDFGRNVAIDHGNGYTTLYAHFATITVRDGISVQKGQEIGTVGNTGNVSGTACTEHGGTHLHFTFIKDNTTGIKPEAMSGNRNFVQYQSYDGVNINNPVQFKIVDNNNAEKSGGNFDSISEGYLGQADYIQGSKTQTASMTWRPNIYESGEYSVYVHIPATNATASVSYEVHYSSGDDSISINQLNFSNQWILLGQYYFNSGTSGYVRLSNNDTSSIRQVGYDAVMFTPPEWGAGGEITKDVPRNLITEITANSIKLSWAAPTGFLPDSYKVYRNNESIATPLTNEYEDLEIETGVEYSYYVVAVNNGEESFGSNIVLAKISNCLLPEDWYVESNLYQYQCTVTAQITDKDNVLIDEPGGLVAAFVNNECRGLAEISQGPSGSMFFLQIWSNTTSGETVQFKYFNTNTCEPIVSFQATIQFEDSKSFGSVSQPYIIKTIQLIDQKINLVQGWNWISIQVKPQDNDMSINTIFSSINSKSEKIVSQQGFSEYYSGWYGTVSQIKLQSMYMLKMKEPASLIIQGVPIDPNETPIELNMNWNWIGYFPQTSIALGQALKSIDGKGIKIVGQNGYAEYAQGWWGSLNKLDPGKGYKLQMNSSSNLTYPTSSTTLSTRKSRKSRKSASRKNKSYWQIVNEDFQFQSTITLSINSNDPIVSNSQLAAFVDGECRGIANPIITPFGTRFFLQVWGNNNGESLTLYYFDPERNKVHEIIDQMDFYVGMSIGNINDPYEIKIEY